MSFGGIIIDTVNFFSSHTPAVKMANMVTCRFYVYNTPGSIYCWKLLIAGQTRGLPEELSFISLKPL